MTVEKAIKHLEVMKDDCALVGDLCALDMAISDLSAENKADFLHNKLIRDATTEERCCICGGVKRFGICQDCGSDM